MIENRGTASQNSTTAAETRPKAAGSRPYSPRAFNALTKQRFTLDRWRHLVDHLGRDPSFPERILIGRIVALEWNLLRQDAKVDAGEDLSPHALRARMAAENRLRLDLTALGLRPGKAAPRGRTMADILAAARTGKEVAA